MIRWQLGLYIWVTSLAHPLFVSNYQLFLQVHFSCSLPVQGDAQTLNFLFLKTLIASHIQSFSIIISSSQISFSQEYPWHRWAKGSFRWWICFFSSTLHTMCWVYSAKASFLLQSLSRVPSFSDSWLFFLLLPSQASFSELTEIWWSGFRLQDSFCTNARITQIFAGKLPGSRFFSAKLRIFLWVLVSWRCTCSWDSSVQFWEGRSQAADSESDHSWRNHRYSIASWEASWWLSHWSLKQYLIFLFHSFQVRYCHPDPKIHHHFSPIS